MTQVKSVPTPELPNASAALLSINNRICLSKAYIPTAALPSSMPCDPGPRPQKKGDCQLLPAETTKRLQINPCREFRRLHCKAKFHCLFFDTLPPRLSTDHSYSRLAMQLFRKDRQARHCWVLFQLAHRYSRATGPPKYQSKTVGSFLLMPEESSENSGCHDWSWKQLELLLHHWVGIVCKRAIRLFMLLF